jgi:hypothetical protein
MPSGCTVTSSWPRTSALARRPCNSWYICSSTSRGEIRTGLWGLMNRNQKQSFQVVTISKGMSDYYFWRMQDTLTVHNWTDHTFRSINWKVHGKAPNALEKSTALDFIIKFAHDHLPTRRHMHRIKKAETDKCRLASYTLSKQSGTYILSCPRRFLWREESLIATLTQPDLTLIPSHSRLPGSANVSRLLNVRLEPRTPIPMPLSILQGGGGEARQHNRFIISFYFVANSSEKDREIDRLPSKF